MALRPTELQIILAATRDIERAQQIQQHQPRSQQENLVLQFQRELEQRKRQAQASAKPEQGEVNKASDDEKNKTSSSRKRKALRRGQAGSDDDRNDQTGPGGEHIIDLLI